MKRIALIVYLILFTTVVTVCAAGPGKADFEEWSKAANVSGYSFGGIDEPDPGISMAIWMNPQQEMIAVRLEPATNFKGYQLTLNKKKPIPFTYKGMTALYIDALAPSAMVVVNYEKSGKLLSISNQNQPKVMTKDELVLLLDGMKPENLMK